MYFALSADKLHLSDNIFFHQEIIMLNTRAWLYALERFDPVGHRPQQRFMPKWRYSRCRYFHRIHIVAFFFSFFSKKNYVENKILKKKIIVSVTIRTRVTMRAFLLSLCLNKTNVLDRSATLPIAVELTLGPLIPPFIRIGKQTVQSFVRTHAQHLITFTIWHMNTGTIRKSLNL